MKDISEDQEILFGSTDVGIDTALERVEVAIGFLWDEKEKSSSDKVAGDYAYEELLGTLLMSRSALKEAQRLRQDLEKFEEEN